MDTADGLRVVRARQEQTRLALVQVEERRKQLKRQSQQDAELLAAFEAKEEKLAKLLDLQQILKAEELEEELSRVQDALTKVAEDILHGKAALRKKHHDQQKNEEDIAQLRVERESVFRDLGEGHDAAPASDPAATTTPSQAQGRDSSASKQTSPISAAAGGNEHSRRLERWKFPCSQTGTPPTGRINATSTGDQILNLVNDMNSPDTAQTRLTTTTKPRIADLAEGEDDDPQLSRLRKFVENIFRYNGVLMRVGCNHQTCRNSLGEAANAPQRSSSGFFIGANGYTIHCGSVHKDELRRASGSEQILLDIAIHAAFCDMRVISEDELKALDEGRVPWKRVPASHKHRAESIGGKRSTRESLGSISDDLVVGSPIIGRPTQSKKRQKISEPSSEATQHCFEHESNSHEDIRAHTTPTPQASTNRPHAVAPQPSTEPSTEVRRDSAMDLQPKTNTFFQRLEKQIAHHKSA